MPRGICPFAEWIPGVTARALGGEPKVGFADHTLAGWYETARNPEFWNNGGFSVHGSIARDGRIAQTVNIFDRAFGQGRDSRGQQVGPLSPGVSWPPFAQMGKRNPNEYLISTEHEDAYILNGVTRFTATWTPEMYEADLMWKSWCREEIQREMGIDVLRFGFDSLAGHYMFDPVSRSNCPGTPWKNEYRFQLYDDLTATAEQGDEMRAHPVWAAWFENKPYPKSLSGMFEVAQIGADFVLPNEAKVVVFEQTLKSGSVVWMHGDTWNPVAQLGPNTFMGVLPPNRTLRFRMLEDAVFQRLQCLGYYV